MNPLRILLADDHDLVRAGFRSILEERPGMSVVAEAGDGREAVRLVEVHRPDVVLMDIRMADACTSPHWPAESACPRPDRATKCVRRRRRDDARPHPHSAA